jgi:hypothetical protein
MSQPLAYSRSQAYKHSHHSIAPRLGNVMRIVHLPLPIFSPRLSLTKHKRTYTNSN